MGYSPEIDGQVNPYEFDGDSLFHLFGDDYIYIYTRCISSYMDKYKLKRMGHVGIVTWTSHHCSDIVDLTLGQINRVINPPCA